MSDELRKLRRGKEYMNCILCHTAPCRTLCEKCNPARIIRALRFDNVEEAAALLPDDYVPSWTEKAQQACPAGVRIDDIMTELQKIKPKLEGTAGARDIDLSCDICGVKLENPFLLSSSVVASSYEMCARAFDMGWAGAAFKTISYIEMHEASPRFSAVRDARGDWAGFKNIEQLSDHSVEENMEIIRRLKKNYPSKVIIASIMGRNESEWESLARAASEAGADIIECNFSCPNMEAHGTGSDIGQDMDAVFRFTKAAKAGAAVPVITKMTPNITDITVPASVSIEAGADGIAAINTIKSITGVNIDTFVSQPSIHGYSMIGGYSGRAVKPIALRYIAELASCDAVKGHHISAMGGIVTWRDSVEFLLLGAGSLQVTTAVMEYGYRIIADLVSGLKIYMAQRNLRSISDFCGSALDSLVGNDQIERDTRVFPIINKERCIGCGRCYVSCRDGGHQAITFNKDSRTVKLQGAKCVGCQLCSLVCPSGAIKQSKRVGVRNRT